MNISSFLTYMIKTLFDILPFKTILTLGGRLKLTLRITKKPSKTKTFVNKFYSYLCFCIEDGNKIHILNPQNTYFIKFIKLFSYFMKIREIMSNMCFEL